MVQDSSNPFGYRIDWDSSGYTEIENHTGGGIAGWNNLGVPDIIEGSIGQILVINSSGSPVFSSGTGLIVPVGAVTAWLKSYTNTPALPDGWVECNGQTLSDAQSVYNGQVIPNLNASGGGTQRFLRGSITSGSVGGSDSHTHAMPTSASGTARYSTTNIQDRHNSNTDATSTLPSYYEVVWIMRVK